MKKNEKNNSLMKITNPTATWTLGAQLGAGSFGEVYMATNRQGSLEAVKICKIDEQETFSATKIEVEILMLCQHENILRAFETYYWDKKIWIFMELCSGGALENILDILDGLDEPTARVILFQCLSGLEYLHRSCYMHRDIKAGNLMLTDKGICKIADFGVTAVLSEPFGTALTFIGTPYWMAPEVILTETQSIKYDCKADVYSVGITAIELVEGMPPDHDLAPQQILVYRMRSDSPTLLNPARWSVPYAEFVKLSLMKQPSRRPSCQQCLELELFKGNDVRSNELLIELFNIYQAFKQGDINVEEISEEEGINIRNSQNRRFISYKMNGVQKMKSVTKMADPLKSEHDEFKILRDKVIHQQRDEKAQEAREIKKLEAFQKSQLDESMLEKYRMETDFLSRNLLKDLEKRKTQFRAEMEKVVRKNRSLMEKERKNVQNALKSKNKSKIDLALLVN
ncbi:Serine/threonine-protein kinase 10 [Thelohanellus kitauei]|uniref:Serine/threonine-protein kinase 10 n=1 Tax=Thelohanellus kitauei TaxID=669202 RepID=A0A0C2N5X1_THEKT|nr:Serine/threonine-protein kinase 10 [Thelohanellus kitauei]